jgi:hypothetical protein
MSTAAAEDPRPARHELHLGRVDQVRVRVAYSRMLDGPAYDVFVLDVPGVGAEGAFDEMPYLETLEPILYADERAPRDYSVHVNRNHTSWGAAAGDVELRVNLIGPRMATTLTAPALDAVADAFRTVLEMGGPPEPVELGEDEAVATACARVEEAYPQVHSDVLSVSEVEHRPAQRAWSVGLRTRDLDRYLVVVGFLDGYAGSTHIRHEPRSEVIDSVGSETP